jgi:YD repeat-containing protein
MTMNSNTDIQCPAGTVYTLPRNEGHPYYTTGQIASSLPGWLNSLGVGSVYSLGMGYAGNGNVTAATDSENGNWTYTYDTLNRMHTAVGASQSFTYTLDQWGNMTCTNTTNSTNLLQIIYINSTTNNTLTYSGVIPVELQFQYNYPCMVNLVARYSLGVYTCVRADCNRNVGWQQDACSCWETFNSSDQYKC